MTVERDPAAEETVRMPQPHIEERTGEEPEEFDPEKTLVRENWESVAIRRVAPHVAAVQSEMALDAENESRYGWESEGLRRLAEGLRRVEGRASRDDGSQETGMHTSSEAGMHASNAHG